MAKIAFVTGAAGFLGRNVLEVLRDEHWQVHVLLRGATPQWMHGWPNLVVETGDLDDASAVLRAMPAGCDAVFHLAGNTSSWVGDAPAIYRDNVLATQRVVEAAMQHGARRLVMTSTLGVFASSQGTIHEQTPMLEEGTSNPYLRSKLQAERHLALAERHGISTVRMHPGHILGRYDVNGWVSIFKQAQQRKLGPAPGGRASFCLAADVARAHVRAATLTKVAPRYVLTSADASYLDLFNGAAVRMGCKPVQRVPGGIIKTVAWLSRWQASITGKAPTITPGLASILTGDLLGDATLARRDLGFASTTLETMLDETSAYLTAL